MSSSSSLVTMANSSSSSSSSSLSLNQAHHFITIKLTNSNYLIWKTQVVPFLRGQSLYGFIDGSYHHPPATILNTEKDPQPIPNSKAAQWDKQEQLVQSLLISSLSESIIPLVVDQTTAAGIWNVLSSSLASTSHARILQLSISMQDPQLSSETAEAYLYQLKGIADELALAGRPLDDDSFNTFVFHGLRSEYESIIDSLTTRGSSIPYSELLGLIRNKDILLGTPFSNLSISSSFSSPPANVSRTSFHKNNSRNRGSVRSSPNFHRQNHINRIPPSSTLPLMQVFFLFPLPTVRPTVDVVMYAKVLIIFIIVVHIAILFLNTLPLPLQWLITLLHPLV